MEENEEDTTMGSTQSQWQDLNEDQATKVAQVLVILGAAASLISVFVLVFGRWRDLGSYGQVGALASFAVASGAGGRWLLRKESEPLRQAGSFVWLLTVALVYGTATAVTKNFDVVPDGLSRHAARALPWGIRGMPSLVAAIVLLAKERRIAQGIAAITAGLATALGLYGVAGRLTPGATGIVVVGVGLIALLLTWLDELGARIEMESIACALIAFGTLLPNYDRSPLWAPVLGAAVGASLVAASVVARSQIARVIGVLMTSVFVLEALFQVIRSPFALLAAGAILMTGGIAVARLLRRARG